MAVSGFRRYVRLFKHIANPLEYILRRGERRTRPLHFVARPQAVQFDIDEPVYQVFKELFMQDVYEINTLVRQLPPNPVVVDIGANVGLFAVQLLSKVKNASVYAFEPVPANVDTFRRTIAQNERLQRCVQLFPMAVTGKAQASIRLFAEAGDTGQVVASALTDFHANNTEAIDVPCITFTDIIGQHQLAQIDLLKVDCEGSEYDIFYHTDAALFQRIGRITMEVHDLDQARNNVTALATYLRSLGFRVTHKPINDWCHALEAHR